MAERGTTPNIPAWRRTALRAVRAFFTPLLPIPMLLGGDEIGRTQGATTTPTARTTRVSRFDWDHEDGALLACTQRLIAFRRAHAVFRRRHFFHGESLGADAVDARSLVLVRRTD